MVDSGEKRARDCKSLQQRGIYVPWIFKCNVYLRFSFIWPCNVVTLVDVTFYLNLLDLAGVYDAGQHEDLYRRLSWRGQLASIDKPTSELFIVVYGTFMKGEQCLYAIFMNDDAQWQSKNPIALLFTCSDTPIDRYSTKSKVQQWKRRSNLRQLHVENKNYEWVKAWWKDANSVIKHQRPPLTHPPSLELLE